MYLRPYVAIIIAAAIKKDCSYRSSCGIRLHAMYMKVLS